VWNRLEVCNADAVVVGTEEAFALLPAGTKRPPGFLRIDEFLMMRRADDEG